MQKTPQEVLAFLIELHAALAQELRDLKRGQFKIFAGGTELHEVTTERIASLEWRVPELERTIAGYREGIKDLT